jgi:flagellar L-ring protein precursor FlgH
MTARISATLSLLIGAAAIALGGCQGAPKRDPAFAPVRPEVPAPARPTAGAIFAVEDSGRLFHESSFFTDTRARRIGDILTIRLVEETSAEKEVENVIEKETTLRNANPTILGANPSIPRVPLVPNVLPPDETTRRYTLENNISANTEFDGSGETSQSNRIEGQITVVVSEVLPNGNLMVQGEKVVTLTRGNEYVRFSGIVRPLDINADNTVDSTRVANATIHYAGDGEVADSSALGWLGRFFISAIMPF